METKEFTSPVYNVKRVHIDKIRANAYNPNSVAPQEMKLLEKSIWEDGYTMPVVCYYIPEEDVYEIVDGYHRYTTLKTSQRIFEREKGYLPVSIIQFTRGCPYNCSFCSTAGYFNHTHIFRDPESVVEEIRRDNLKFLLFADDNITANPDKAKELFHALIPLKIKWAGQASIEMVKDSELLLLMKKSGCLGQLIGFDSMDEDSLKWMN